MTNLLLFLLALLRARISFYQNKRIKELEIEVLILRQQLSTLKQVKKVKPKLSKWDRAFWVLVKNHIRNWKNTLVIVKPETVIGWHKKGFKLFWKIKSKNKGGRPRIDRKTINLIKKMAKSNPRWGAPRIHGELLKFGIKISEASVGRYMPRRNHLSQNQTWKTFLHNTMGESISMDFFTMPTVNFKILYGLVILSHKRREILHLSVTSNPNSWWVMGQLKECLEEKDFKYLIRDNDSIYSREFKNLLESYSLRDCPTQFRSPWQNPFCERVIGSIRRDLLDHIIVINKDQVGGLLSDYKDYYNNHRTHLGIDKKTPIPSPIEFSTLKEETPILGGLHHIYGKLIPCESGEFTARKVGSFEKAA